MSSSVSNAIAPNEPVTQKEQQTALNSNGVPPETNNEAAQAAMRIQQKYAEERDKRLRKEGPGQYIDLALSGEKYRRFREDPWLDERSEKVIMKDGDRTKYLILGGGFGGVLFGCHLVKAGVKSGGYQDGGSCGGVGWDVVLESLSWTHV